MTHTDAINAGPYAPDEYAALMDRLPTGHLRKAWVALVVDTFSAGLIQGEDDLARVLTAIAGRTTVVRPYEARDGSTAARALAALRRDPQRPMAASQVAVELGIGTAYAAQVLKTLARHGLVRMTEVQLRGPRPRTTIGYLALGEDAGEGA